VIYFALLRAQQLVQVQEAAVARAEQFHKTIESKYELGSASLSEVLKARVQLGTEQLALLQNNNDVSDNLARLNTVLNRNVDEPLEVAEVDVAGPTSLTYEDALAIAAEESPQIRGARASVKVAKNEVGIARATLFPTFSWNATRSYGYESSSELLDFDSDKASWSAGLSLRFNLFDAFDRKTSISNASVGLKYEKEIEQQIEKNVALVIKQSYLGVELANESRRLAEQTAESAQEDFNLAQEKYNLGAATILDLLDAQASLTRAQTDRVNALYGQYLAAARLENAVGRR
jgi:outer membrane protein TolC